MWEWIKRLFGWGLKPAVVVVRKIGGKRLTGAVLAAAITTVGASEGLRLKAYLDPVGIPTICYGETLGVKLGQVKTAAECKAMFAERLGYFDKQLNRLIPDLDKIPDSTYLALLSFVYNVGEGNLQRSTLLKLLNQGKIVAACNELPKWNKAGGKVLRGLTIRRAEEKALCLKQEWY